MTALGAPRRSPRRLARVLASALALTLALAARGASAAADCNPASEVLLPDGVTCAPHPCLSLATCTACLSAGAVDPSAYAYDLPHDSFGLNPTEDEVYPGSALRRTVAAREVAPGGAQGPYGYAEVGESNATRLCAAADCGGGWRSVDGGMPPAWNVTAAGLGAGEGAVDDLALLGGCVWCHNDAQPMCLPLTNASRAVCDPGWSHDVDRAPRALLVAPPLLASAAPAATAFDVALSEIDTDPLAIGATCAAAVGSHCVDVYTADAASCTAVPDCAVCARGANESVSELFCTSARNASDGAVVGCPPYDPDDPSEPSLRAVADIPTCASDADCAPVHGDGTVCTLGRCTCPAGLGGPPCGFLPPPPETPACDAGAVPTCPPGSECRAAVPKMGEAWSGHRCDCGAAGALQPPVDPGAPPTCVPVDALTLRPEAGQAGIVRLGPESCGGGGIFPRYYSGERLVVAVAAAGSPASPALGVRITVNATFDDGDRVVVYRGCVGGSSVDRASFSPDPAPASLAAWEDPWDALLNADGASRTEFTASGQYTVEPSAGGRSACVSIAYVSRGTGRRLGPAASAAGGGRAAGPRGCPGVIVHAEAAVPPSADTCVSDLIAGPGGSGGSSNDTGAADLDFVYGDTAVGADEFGRARGTGGDPCREWVVNIAARVGEQGYAALHSIAVTAWRRGSSSDTLGVAVYTTQGAGAGPGGSHIWAIADVPFSLSRDDLAALNATHVVFRLHRAGDLGADGRLTASVAYVDPDRADQVSPAPEEVPGFVCDVAQLTEAPEWGVGRASELQGSAPRCFGGNSFCDEYAIVPAPGVLHQYVDLSGATFNFPADATLEVWSGVPGVPSSARQLTVIGAGGSDIAGAAAAVNGFGDWGIMGPAGFDAPGQLLVRAGDSGEQISIVHRGPLNCPTSPASPDPGDDPANRDAAVWNATVMAGMRQHAACEANEAPVHRLEVGQGVTLAVTAANFSSEDVRCHAVSFSFDPLEGGVAVIVMRSVETVPGRGSVAVIPAANDALMHNATTLAEWSGSSSARNASAQALNMTVANGTAGSGGQGNGTADTVLGEFDPTVQRPETGLTYTVYHVPSAAKLPPGATSTPDEVVTILVDRGSLNSTGPNATASYIADIRIEPGFVVGSNDTCVRETRALSASDAVASVVYEPDLGYPHLACRDWDFVAPPGYTGLEITVDRFDTEQDADFLNIFLDRSERGWGGAGVDLPRLEDGNFTYSAYPSGNATAGNNATIPTFVAVASLSGPSISNAGKTIAIPSPRASLRFRADNSITGIGFAVSVRPLRDATGSGFGAGSGSGSGSGSACATRTVLRAGSADGPMADRRFVVRRDSGLDDDASASGTTCAEWLLTAPEVPGPGPEDVDPSPRPAPADRWELVAQIVGMELTDGARVALYAGAAPPYALTSSSPRVVAMWGDGAVGGSIPVAPASIPEPVSVRGSLVSLVYRRDTPAVPGDAFEIALWWRPVASSPCDERVVDLAPDNRETLSSFQVPLAAAPGAYVPNACQRWRVRGPPAGGAAPPSATAGFAFSATEFAIGDMAGDSLVIRACTSSVAGDAAAGSSDDTDPWRAFPVEAQALAGRNPGPSIGLWTFPPPLNTSGPAGSNVTLDHLCVTWRSGGVVPVGAGVAIAVSAEAEALDEAEANSGAHWSVGSTCGRGRYGPDANSHAVFHDGAAGRVSTLEPYNPFACLEATIVPNVMSNITGLRRELKSDEWSLYFERFDTEKDADVLRVVEGTPSGGGDVLATLSGRDPPASAVTLRPSRGNVTVLFTADAMIQGRGVALRWIVHPENSDTFVPFLTGTDIVQTSATAVEDLPVELSLPRVVGVGDTYITVVLTATGTAPGAPAPSEWIAQTFTGNLDVVTAQLAGPFAFTALRDLCGPVSLHLSLRRDGRTEDEALGPWHAYGNVTLECVNDPASVSLSIAGVPVPASIAAIAANQPAVVGITLDDPDGDTSRVEVIVEATFGALRVAGPIPAGVDLREPLDTGAAGENITTADGGAAAPFGSPVVVVGPIASLRAWFAAGALTLTVPDTYCSRPAMRSAVSVAVTEVGIPVASPTKTAAGSVDISCVAAVVDGPITTAHHPSDQPRVFPFTARTGTSQASRVALVLPGAGVDVGLGLRVQPVRPGALGRFRVSCSVPPADAAAGRPPFRFAPASYDAVAAAKAATGADSVIDGAPTLSADGRTATFEVTQTAWRAGARAWVQIALDLNATRRASSASRVVVGPSTVTCALVDPGLGGLAATEAESLAIVPTVPPFRVLASPSADLPILPSTGATARIRLSRSPEVFLRQDGGRGVVAISCSVVATDPLSAASWLTVTPSVGLSNDLEPEVVVTLADASSLSIPPEGGPANASVVCTVTGGGGYLPPADIGGADLASPLPIPLFFVGGELHVAVADTLGGSAVLVGEGKILSIVPGGVAVVTLSLTAPPVGSLSVDVACESSDDQVAALSSVVTASFSASTWSTSRGAFVMRAEHIVGSGVGPVRFRCRVTAAAPESGYEIGRYGVSAEVSFDAVGTGTGTGTSGAGAGGTSGTGGSSGTGGTGAVTPGTRSEPYAAPPSITHVPSPGSRSPNCLVAGDTLVLELERGVDDPAQRAVSFEPAGWVNATASVWTRNNTVATVTLRETPRPMRCDADLYGALRASAGGTTVSLIPSSPPTVISFSVADTTDDGDACLSVGDVLAVTFNMVTDAPPIATRAQVDAAIEFSQPLGVSDYVGRWDASGRIAVIRITRAGEGSACGAVGVMAIGLRARSVGVTDAARTWDARNGAPPPWSPRLSGSLGRAARVTALRLSSLPSESGDVSGVTVTRRVQFAVDFDRPVRDADLAVMYPATGLGAGIAFNGTSSILAALSFSPAWPPSGATVVESADTAAAVNASTVVPGAPVYAISASWDAAGEVLLLSVVATGLRSASSLSDFPDFTVGGSGGNTTATTTTTTTTTTTGSSSSSSGGGEGWWPSFGVTRVSVATVASAIPAGPKFDPARALAARVTAHDGGATSPPLVATAGLLTVPRISNVVVRDPDNLDAHLCDGDEIVVTFDRATDAPALDSTSAVSAHFAFGVSDGTDGNAAWLPPPPSIPFSGASNGSGAAAAAGANISASNGSGAVRTSGTAQAAFNLSSGAAVLGSVLRGSWDSSGSIATISIVSAAGASGIPEDPRNIIVASRGIRARGSVEGDASTSFDAGTRLADPASSYGKGPALSVESIVAEHASELFPPGTNPLTDAVAGAGGAGGGDGAGVQNSNSNDTGSGNGNGNGNGTGNSSGRQRRRARHLRLEQGTAITGEDTTILLTGDAIIFTLSHETRAVPGTVFDEAGTLAMVAFTPSPIARRIRSVWVSRTRYAVLVDEALPRADSPPPSNLTVAVNFAALTAGGPDRVAIASDGALGAGGNGTSASPFVTVSSPVLGRDGHYDGSYGTVAPASLGSAPSAAEDTCDSFFCRGVPWWIFLIVAAVTVGAVAGIYFLCRRKEEEIPAVKMVDVAIGGDSDHEEYDVPEMPPLEPVTPRDEDQDKDVYSDDSTCSIQ